VHAPLTLLQDQGSIVRPRGVYYVYILSNRRRTVFYTGSTEGLRKRVYFHKKGLIEGFTRRYNVDQLVYYEHHDDLSSARKREKQVKSYSRAKKQALVKTMNSGWNDLFEQLS
jgi:putative endonuclease